MTPNPGTEFNAAALAAELRDAEESRDPAPLLTARFPNMTWRDARAVALARDDLRVADGEAAIGYKLGWTSSAMRRALGVDQPNWGTLWGSQAVETELTASRLICPKIEPEIVVRCGATRDQDEWALGLEIVDPRYGTYDFDWLDNTADNSSCARIAVGPFNPRPDAETVGITFSDSRSTRHGDSSDALGGPDAAIDWLRESLAAENRELRAGDLIFTGGLAAPFDLIAGSTYTVSSHELAPVRLSAV